MSAYILDALNAVYDRFRPSGVMEPLPILPSVPHLRFGTWSPGVMSEEAEQGAMLYSIEAAGDRYRIVTLGAGPGEWAIRAEKAYRWKNPHGDFLSCCVEGDLDHYNMVFEFLDIVGTDRAHHDVRHAVIAEQDGVALFPIINAAIDWGAAIASLASNPDDLASNMRITDVEKSHRIGANGGKPIEYRQVEAVTLATLMRKIGTVDFLHCDVQGAERQVFPNQMQAMNEQVRLACISAHAREIEVELKALFAENGWHLQADYTSEYTPEGFLYRDGTLIFHNPRLAA